MKWLYEKQSVTSKTDRCKPRAQTHSAISIQKGNGRCEKGSCVRHYWSPMGAIAQPFNQKGPTKRGTIEKDMLCVVMLCRHGLHLGLFAIIF